MNTSQRIEALLFYLAEPINIGRLVRMLKVDHDEIVTAVAQLEAELHDRGIRLLRHDDTIELVTAPEASELIRALVKEELSKDLSKASVETLTIVLYKGPVTRSEIDHIRGVNSTFILRNLLIRGLIEKVEHPTDQRSFHYQSTTDLLKQLGITSVDQLPNYHETIAELAHFMSSVQADIEQPSEHSLAGSEIESELEEIKAADLSEDLVADSADIEQAGGSFNDQELGDHEQNAYGEHAN
jgi:segregation and condensation protein B